MKFSLHPYPSNFQLHNKKTSQCKQPHERLIQRCIWQKEKRALFEFNFRKYVLESSSCVNKLLEYSIYALTRKTIEIYSNGWLCIDIKMSCIQGYLVFLKYTKITLDFQVYDAPHSHTTSITICLFTKCWKFNLNSNTLNWFTIVRTRCNACSIVSASANMIFNLFQIVYVVPIYCDFFSILWKSHF